MDKAILPEKCCATCGFLCCIAFDAADRENALFDPDLMRSPDYPNPVAEMVRGYSQGYLSSLPVIARRTWTERGQKLTDPGVPALPSWLLTRSVNCYRGQFSAIQVRALWQDRPWTRDEFSEAEAQTVPIDWDVVRDTIRKDRRDCRAYYLYHAGFTPAQHTSMQLEERQHERDYATARSLNHATWGMACASVALLFFAVVSAAIAMLGVVATLISASATVVSAVLTLLAPHLAGR